MIRTTNSDLVTIQTQMCEDQFMLDEGILGSSVAFAILLLSLFCAFELRIPSFYFAIALALWILYSAYRLYDLVARQLTRTSISHVRNDALIYWLAATGSSFLAPLLWLLVMSHIKVF
jgi:hypothetical protein